MTEETQEKKENAQKLDKLQVENILRTVIDPEIQMDIVSLGLIYKTEIVDDAIKIEMTLTTPMCPFGPALLEEIKHKLSALANTVTVDLVFEPAWQPPDEIKMMFGL